MSKKIIVLSDGTGNSAAKVWRTNVWRTFEALDLTRSDQVAMYDDGVGTSSFKPVAILGGAFGYGLKRNVLSLYKFLCRNYKSRQDYQAEGIQSEDDDIFAFGFSRGAFTIRVLVGLVLDQGLVNYETEDELDRKTKAAYRQYRAKNFKTYTGIEVLFRWLRSWFVSASHDSAQRAVSHVRFLGLWDTVAAYGFPVDELTRGVSRYLWPLELPNRQLDTDRVRKACHALSIDDERTTFHPVLWDETDIPKPPIQRCGIRRTRSERVSQVWFAGVHANVGGGYPDDGLAYVTLQWMMDEANQSGLRFYPDLRTEYDDCADPQGRQYDSRAGLAGYYRYGPRNVDDLCNDPDHGVAVARPKVHDSVGERISRWQVAYAPVSFPDHVARGYEVVGRFAAAPVLRPMPAFESAADAAGRGIDMEAAFDAVLRRRAAYFMTVAFTFILAVLPVFDWITALDFWKPVSASLDASVPTVYHLLAAPFSAAAWVGDELAGIPGWSMVTRLIGGGLKWVVAQQFFPAWLSFWLKSFGNHPALSVFCGLTVFWLFVRKSGQLENQVFARAEYAWRRV
jgi:uncharacterized protein (DUF2235 family)